jgi:hypothetical protein
MPQRRPSPLKQPTHSQIELGSLHMLLRGTRASTRFDDLSHRARWAYGVVNFKRLVQSQSRLPGDDDQYPESVTTNANIFAAESGNQSPVS